MAQRRETLFRSGSVNMRTLNLLSAFFKVNVQLALAYRADTVVNILLNIMWLGWELLSLSIIFNQPTDSHHIALHDLRAGELSQNQLDGIVNKQLERQKLGNVLNEFWHEGERHELT